MAEEAGVHPFEYQASVDIGASASQIVILRRNSREWSQTFTPEELTKVPEPVFAFFAATVREMAQTVEKEQLDFMKQRKV